MRKLFATYLLLMSFSASAAEIKIIPIRDGFGLKQANIDSVIYLDGDMVLEHQPLPATIHTNEKKVDITFCYAKSDICESATIYPDSTKPIEVGYLMQSFIGGIYFKVLTGGGLKVTKARLAEQEAKDRAIAE